MITVAIHYAKFQLSTFCDFRSTLYIVIKQWVSEWDTEVSKWVNGCWFCKYRVKYKPYDNIQ